MTQRTTGKTRARRTQNRIDRIPVLLFEAFTRCNLRCIYCYNCWKAPGPYPTGQLTTRATIGMLKKVLRDAKAERIAFTGGEPLLRDDLPDLIFSVRALGLAATLLTNGALLDRDWVTDLKKAKVSQVQLTLLGTEPAVHDRHCGAGHFDKVMAALEILDASKIRATVNMVVTRLNVDQVPGVMEFVARRRQPLFLLNRFNPGGAGLAPGMLDTLMLDRDDLRRMLGLAQEAAVRFKVTPAAAVPIPPCVADRSKYPDVRFSGCNAASKRTYPAINPLGNARMCNHSPAVLGNVTKDDILDLVNGPAAAEWRTVKPAFCEPCPGWDACLGGCRAAGQQMGLGLDSVDPFVARLLGV